MPVPRSRENASDSTEAAQLFGSFFREEKMCIRDRTMTIKEVEEVIKMKLFTFIADYKGGTYISQYVAKTLEEALNLWINNCLLYTSIPVLNLPVHFLNFTTIADQKEPDLRTLYHVG